MKHRTDLRHAHRRIRQLEQQLAWTRHAKDVHQANLGKAINRELKLYADARSDRRRIVELSAQLLCAQAEGARAMVEAHQLRHEPLLRIAAHRLRTWLARSCR